MVNEFTCNHIVRSDSVMVVSIFCKKNYSDKIGWHYIVSYICYIAFIESDYFLWVKKTTKYLIKKFIFRCVNTLFQLIFLSKMEL